MVLMTMAICAIALIGAMGLAVDLGHIFIVKNETQAYVDAAAIAAALMDGTTAGTPAPTRATSLSATGTDSATLTTPTVEFSTASSGAPGIWPPMSLALAPTMRFTASRKP
jgi:uncharacterized membrane protein